MSEGPHVSFAPLSTVEREHWSACRDIGTVVCLRCEHADHLARPGCHFECHRCRFALSDCPCSREGWQRRQLAVTGEV
jgi:hypothetical protein